MMVDWSDQRPIDLVFVVGCFDTMDEWMHTLAHGLEPMAKQLGLRFGSAGLRFGFVGFRDYGAADGQRFEIGDLTDNLAALRLFMLSAGASCSTWHHMQCMDCA